MDRDKDALYWTLRQKNDLFLKRQQWAYSRRRDRHTELARQAERWTQDQITGLGYQVHQTTNNCPFDLWVQRSDGKAVRVEVKISLYNQNARGGRYQANVRHHHQADLLVFIARNGRNWPYIIPMQHIAPRRNIAIWSYCPGDYSGQWAVYLGAWDQLHRAIETAAPKDFQLPLFWEA